MFSLVWRLPMASGCISFQRRRGCSVTWDSVGQIGALVVWNLAGWYSTPSNTFSMAIIYHRNCHKTAAIHLLNCQPLTQALPISRTGKRSGNHWKMIQQNQVEIKVGFFQDLTWQSASPNLTLTFFTNLNLNPLEFFTSFWRFEKKQDPLYTLSWFPQISEKKQLLCWKLPAPVTKVFFWRSVDVRNPAPVEVGTKKSHHLPGFYDHPKWLFGISEASTWSSNFPPPFHHFQGANRVVWLQRNQSEASPNAATGSAPFRNQNGLQIWPWITGVNLTLW